MGVQVQISLYRNIRDGPGRRDRVRTHTSGRAAAGVRVEAATALAIGRRPRASAGLQESMAQEAQFAHSDDSGEKRVAFLKEMVRRLRTNTGAANACTARWEPSRRVATGGWSFWCTIGWSQPPPSHRLLPPR